MAGFKSLFFKKRPQLNRDQILGARPLKNPAVEWNKNEQGQVVITVRRRSDWKGRLFALLFAVPRQRQIVLDEVGTLVWELCDGETSVSAITQQLVRRYKLNVKEAELSLGQYLKVLTQRGMIGLQIDKPQA